MAAEQAAGHREIAAEGYSKVLRDEKLEPSIYNFINDNRKISLLYTGNQEDILTILMEEEKNNYKPSTIPIVQITKEQVQSLIEYEKTQDPSVLENLSQWETLETDSNEVSTNFSVHNLISLTDATIGCAFLNEAYYTDKRKDVTCEILHTLLQECIRTTSQEYLINLSILNHIAHKVCEYKLKNQTTMAVRNNIESMEIEKKYGSLTMYTVSMYSEFIDAYSEKGEQQNINLKLDLIASARKELNFRQCTRELWRVYKCIEYSEHVGLPIGNLSCDAVSMIKDFLMSPKSAAVTSNVWSENVSRAVYEHCKFLYVAKNQNNDAIQFASTAAIGIKNRLIFMDHQQLLQNSQNNLNQQCVKFHIKIAEYLQNESEEILSERYAHGMPLRMLLQSICEEKFYIDEKIPLIDCAIGKLLQDGAKLAPQMTKIWSSLANWYYRWGELNKHKFTFKYFFNKSKKIIKNLEKLNLNFSLQIC